MSRRVRSLLVILSGTLCLAFACQWFRSYIYWDAANYRCSIFKLELRSAGGTFAVGRCFYPAWPQEPWWRSGWSHHAYLSPSLDAEYLEDGGEFARMTWHDAASANEAIMGTQIPTEEDETTFWDMGWWDGQPLFDKAGFAFYHSTPEYEPNGVLWRPARSGCWQIQTPYWFWTVLTAIAPILACRRWIIRGVREQHGRCIHCGYDLRASPLRCPECGFSLKAAAR